MIIVCDTTPINYLVLINEIELLPKLFGNIIIPRSVLLELQRNEAPPKVRKWLAADPDWMTVRSASIIDTTIKLGAGETEAISLANEIDAELVLIDDKKARSEAIKRGLAVAGTLTLLEMGSLKKFLDLKTAFSKLKQTNFRLSQTLINGALEREQQRISSGY